MARLPASGTIGPNIWRRQVDQVHGHTVLETTQDPTHTQNKETHQTLSWEMSLWVPRRPHQGVILPEDQPHWKLFCQVRQDSAAESTSGHRSREGTVATAWSDVKRWISQEFLEEAAHQGCKTARSRQSVLPGQICNFPEKMQNVHLEEVNGQET